MEWDYNGGRSTRELSVTNNETVGLLLVALSLGMLALSIYRRRHHLTAQARFYLGVTIVCGVTLILTLRLMEPTKALLVTFLVEVIVLIRWRPRRSRYVSKRDRRKVIARFELSGERYDPKKHEIDHVIPHSRGGTNTADNLRVIARARNRSKSAKSPWWDVFGK
jgi:hypothetical protein